jgi:hypothetical protein
MEFFILAARLTDLIAIPLYRLKYFRHIEGLVQWLGSLVLVGPELFIQVAAPPPSSRFGPAAGAGGLFKNPQSRTVRPLEHA